jgi:hypothetical protein
MRGVWDGLMQSTAHGCARHRLARAALYYATALRWPVFPLRPRDKRPLISKAAGGHGCLDATTDAERVRAWWNHCPSANIGLALCSNGFDAFAIDVDPRNGGDLGELVIQLGPLPHTVQALTGGGGNHVLLMGRVASGILAPGIDIKGAGGYIVLPPSVHPSGELYRWEAWHRPTEVTIAKAPAELMKALGQPRSSKAAPSRGAPTAPEFGLGAAFLAHGTLGPQIKPGVWAVLCPNRAQHTTGSDFDSSTVVLAPRYPGRRGVFKCLHSHCGHLR